MKHLLVSIRNLSGNVPGEFSYVSKSGPTDLLHRMYVDDENSKAILHGQELCACPGFHMEHLSSTKKPVLWRDSLAAHCLSLRAAAGNLMPENR